MRDIHSTRDAATHPSGVDQDVDPLRAAARQIDRARLAGLLDARVSRWTLEVVHETGSTNADLASRLKDGRGERFEPCVRVAYSQTAGRGRRGRPWVAAPGDALLCSLAYLLPRGPEKLGGLSLAIGAAVIQGLRTLLPVTDHARLALKWPNDLLLDDAKVAGILVESAWSTPSDTALVIGIGVNVGGADTLERQIASLPHTACATPPTPPTALSRAWPDAALTPVLGAVLNALARALAQFGQHGFEPFREAWLKDHAYGDREVVVLEQGEQRVRGIACGIDEQGQLLITTADGVATVATGDVSLRLAASVDAPSSPGCA
jgi:BirA family transcriptional regulator, biotin operon repressor / biotin---[acetyl-CoA-carboxylase] ligase